MPQANLNQPIISTVYSKILIDFLSGKGVDVDQFLTQLSLQKYSLTQPDTILPMATFQMMMEEAARFTGDENIGLHYYENIELQDLGVLGYAQMNSKSIRDALNIITRYYKLFQSDNEMLLSENNGNIHLSYRILSKKIIPSRQDSEMTIMAFVATISALLGKPWRPIEVHLQHPQPTDISEHQRLLCNKIFFSSPTNKIVFDSSLLDTAIAGADLKLSSSLEDALEQLLSFKIPAPNDQWLHEVQDAIIESLSNGPPNINEIAEKFHMSGRTLQRRLEKYDLSFKEMLEQIRLQIATNFLEATDLSLLDIAFMLGYSELSSFTRAFRRWTNHPPLEFRLLHRAQPSDNG
ncbi:AraC-like transcriptional regulator QhpR [Dasania marina]|uniref:AraC-like transcriptional regulator QhpR n=1 Tax=Dasania marina TaxID=471499 RepID=UPI00036DF221|nr:AraC family transcriptional regulator [Dasania marina]